MAKLSDISTVKGVDMKHIHPNDAIMQKDNSSRPYVNDDLVKKPHHAKPIINDAIIQKPMDDTLKHIVYLKMCTDLSELSKCVKHKVGAMIVKNSRIISTGVNGTPSGYENCCDHFAKHDMTTESSKLEHRQWSAIYENHSEMNAILHASKHGLSIDGAAMYCTLEPCFNCLKHMIGSGIREIYYAKKHKCNLESTEAKSFIDKLNIHIQHIEI